MGRNFSEGQNFSNENAPFLSENDENFGALFVICWILVICGLVENAIVCCILIRKRRCFKNFSNFHLLNLAITDILFRAGLCSRHFFASWAHIYNIFFSEFNFESSNICLLQQGFSWRFTGYFLWKIEDCLLYRK